MTCLVFFQTALLAGYFYAHRLGSARRAPTALHLTLLTLAAMSAVLWSSGLLHLTRDPEHPVRSIFWNLALTIGLPFIALGSTSPLLQVWLARVATDSIPYRLFALSNIASLLALVAYPTAIEPHLSLTRQRTLWTLGLIVFTVLSGTLAWQTRSLASQALPQPAGERATLRHKLLWFLLPLAASMQLAAITAHLTNNIAAIPLLWIVPLAAYLLSFIVAFRFPSFPFSGGVVRLLLVMLAGLGYMLAHSDILLPISIAILFFLAELFLACLFLHAEAVLLRPVDASESTLFYLLLAAGGAAGSFLIGIAAPLVFSGNYDLALSFLVTALLALLVTWRAGWPQRLLWASATALLVFLVGLLHRDYHHNALLATRNFYGSLRVQQTVTDRGEPIRLLLNGSIQHGTQIFSLDLRQSPTTYYAEDSGIGLALANCCADHPRSIGVIGLGAGTLAAYGRPGDTMRFYELNPAVLPVAENLFTYTRDSPAKITFVDGDARASLTHESPQHFDILVIDAFSGDAIPLHLLTVEALALYQRHLAPGGILAFHVSNQYVDLAPQLAALARASGMQARTIQSPEIRQRGEFKATWVLLTARPDFFSQPNLATRAFEIPNAATLWTDDYSSLMQAMRW